jgi:hypothetical protein
MLEIILILSGLYLAIKLGLWLYDELQKRGLV